MPPEDLTPIEIEQRQKIADETHTLLERGIELNARNHDENTKLSEIGIELQAKQLEKITDFTESLDKLSEFKFSLSALEKIMEGLEQVKGAKGDPGHTPTDEELLALIKPLIPEVKDGKDGEDGKTPTESELLALIRPLVDGLEERVTPTDTRLKKLIKPLIPEVRDGEDGYTPIKGKDYFDGKDGKDGSPDTAKQIVNKLESLNQHLSYSKLKGTPDLEELAMRIKRASKTVSLNELDDVEAGDKRQDLLLQYNTTNKRWQDGIAITVSNTAPTDPKVNDIWIEIS